MPTTTHPVRRPDRDDEARRLRRDDEARRLRRDDEGSLLVVAVLVAFVCLSLGLLVTSQAITTSGDSGRDRQRTGQVHAAEGGVDAAYHRLQQGALPCALPTVSIGTQPDTTQVTTTIAYSTASGPVACPVGPGDPAPTRAVITSSAVSMCSLSDWRQ